MTMPRKRSRPLIEIKRLCELVSYDPDTGLFTWKRKPSWGRKYPFTSVMRTGHISGMIHGHVILAHHVAWALYWGWWPDEIDHINHNPSDNRMSNLREVTRKDNLRNASISINNTSGCTGVSWVKRDKKWRVNILLKNGYRYSKLFKDYAEACDHARMIYKEDGFHPNHGL